MLDLPDPDAPVVHVHTRAHGGLGALSRRALDARIHTGEVSFDDVFWFPGLPEWLEIGRHPELVGDLAPVVPVPGALSEGMVELPKRSTPRPIETLEPESFDVPGHTVASVGHPQTPLSQTPEAVFSLAEADLAGLSVDQHTWVPSLDDAEPLSDASPPLAVDAEPHSDAALPLVADALVPTDTSLGFDEERESAADHFPQLPADPRLDAIFTDLLEATWDYQEAHEFASCVDEVFLGAVVTSALDDGRVLIDLSSDGTHHFLRFEHPENGSRVLLRLTHLTGNLTTSRVQGHMASMVLGYGERVSGFGDIWARLSSRPRSELVPRDQPGALVADGDVASQYIYVQVRLFLRIDDYVSRSWSIDHERLRDHMAACVRALRVHLYGHLR